jgi:hypothetical protein
MTQAPRTLSRPPTGVTPLHDELRSPAIMTLTGVRPSDGNGGMASGMTSVRIQHP